MDTCSKITSPTTLTYHVVVHFSSTFEEKYLDRLEEVANAAFFEIANIGNGFSVLYHCFEFEDETIITRSAVRDDGAIEMALDIAGESVTIGYMPADVQEAIEKALAEDVKLKPN